MKPLLTIILSLVLGGTFLPAAPVQEVEPPPAQNLQMCYQLALVHSETLGMQAEEVKIAEARYWQALGAALPKVHLLGTQEWQDPQTRTSIQPSDLNRSSSANNTFQSQAQVVQPIFNGFRDLFAAQVTIANREASRQNLARARQVLYLDTATLFYQTLSYERSVKVLTEKVQVFFDLEKELQRRMDLGRSRLSELLQTRTSRLDAQAVLQQNIGLLAASKEMLAFLTGIPSEKINLVEETPLPAIREISAYLQASLGRPDLQAERQKVKGADKTVSATKAELAPSVDLEANYNLLNDPRAERDWSVYLTVDIPIFEGGITQARIGEAKAQLRQVKLELSQLERATQRDVRVSYSNFMSYVLQIADLQALEKAADENSTTQKKDYTRGVSAQIDVLSALGQLEDARYRLVNLEMTARLEVIRLAVMSGMVKDNP